MTEHNPKRPEHIAIHTILPLQDVVFQRRKQRSSETKTYSERVSGQQINLLLMEGMSRKDIAKQFNVPIIYITKEISHLRQSGESIPYGIGGTKEQLTHTLHQDLEEKLPKASPREHKPPEPRPESARDKMIRFFEEHSQNHPGEPVNLPQLAAQVGCSRQRASQLYKELAAQHPESVPPSQSAVNQREILQRREAVRKLLEQGYTTPETAAILAVLGESRSRVDEARAELRRSGRLPKVPSPEDRLDVQVLKLRQEKKGDREIAAILDRPVGQISTSLERLRAKGEPVRLRTKRRSSEELDSFYLHVKVLLGQGLSNPQISSLLDVPLHQVVHAAQSLLDREQIGRRATTIHLTPFQREVFRLNQQGVTQTQTAAQLGVRLSNVTRVMRKLRNLGLVPESERTRKQKRTNP